MIEIGVMPRQEGDFVFVQEETALDIALPHILTQPKLPALKRGKLPNVEALAAQIYRIHLANPGGALGRDYQELVNEFQPLFAWTIACWDYLLSTEGCRFLPRHRENRTGIRGDYRAVTDKDYSRMVHAIFRRCVLVFSQHPEEQSLSSWLRLYFWREIVDAYNRLQYPPDPRERQLTAYSYLRCIPYAFLNDFHQDLVYSTVQQLPGSEQAAIDAYFFHFYHESASAETLGWPREQLTEALRQGLLKLLIHNRLVYCLLRQIERY